MSSQNTSTTPPAASKVTLDPEISMLPPVKSITSLPTTPVPITFETPEKSPVISCGKTSGGQIISGHPSYHPYSHPAASSTSHPSDNQATSSSSPPCHPGSNHSKTSPAGHPSGNHSATRVSTSHPSPHPTVILKATESLLHHKRSRKLCSTPSMAEAGDTHTPSLHTAAGSSTTSPLSTDFDSQISDIPVPVIQISQVSDHQIPSTSSSSCPLTSMENWKHNPQASGNLVDCDGRGRSQILDISFHNSHTVDTRLANPDREMEEWNIGRQIPGISEANNHVYCNSRMANLPVPLEEWQENNQPWYTCLYSPVSLEQSPSQGIMDNASYDSEGLQDLQEAQGSSGISYVGSVDAGGMLSNSPLAHSGGLSGTPSIPQGILSGASTFNEAGLPSSSLTVSPSIPGSGGGVLPASLFSFSVQESVPECPFGIKTEERHPGSTEVQAVDGAGLRMEGSGSWLMDNGLSEGITPMWSFKVEPPWGSTLQPRYVSDEVGSPYWVPGAWQVGPGVGLMKDSGGGEEGPTGSPQLEAACSSGSSSSVVGRERPDSKKCGVCGDRALGYNFNAITCESCKAFFRRNALKNKDFRCPFQDNCKVDQVTRRFCQKCRLRKCFEIGMKKEWIMTEEEKQRKKQKIEENRARKLGDVTSDDENSSKCSSSAVPLFSSFTGEDCVKPQAVVVGVMRSDDEGGPAKVQRVSGQGDVHQQQQQQQEQRSIIQSTGHVQQHTMTASSALYSPSNVLFPFEATTSPESRRSMSPAGRSGHDAVPSPCTTTTTTTTTLHHHHHHTDALQLNLERFHSDPEPPNNPLHGSQDVGDDLGGEGGGGGGSGTQDSSPQVGGGGALSPTPSTSHHHLKSLAQVLAINIKKEKPFPSTSTLPTSPSTVEYQDEDSEQEGISQCLEAGPMADDHLLTTDQSQQEDAWQDFSVHDALTFLRAGCKSDKAASGLTVMNSIMDTAIQAEYSDFSLLGRYNPKQLNDSEKMKLNELSEANKGLLAPLCEDYNFKDLSNPSLINIINLTEIAIRRLIKMAKRILAFKSLCQEDQIALLKGGCTEMMILRSVCAYDPDKDSWKIQQDHDRIKNIKLKVLKAAPGNVYEEHKRFIMAFQPEWRTDHNIIFLLSAITLFNPERRNTVHTHAIRHEQCSYLYLLKRYLECKLGGCEGRTVYHRLLEIINHLHMLSENHIRVFLEVNPQDVEPLLIEIFDLKQR